MAQTRKNIVILSVLYLISRLIFLTRYPIFNDEAIYLRYAWIMTHIPKELWYSLSDSGKQPLLFWLYGLTGMIIHDPLFAGRLVSVVIGMTTLWAVYLLGGWAAGILLITAPLFVFFDRLALVDIALAAIFAWLLVLWVRLKKQNAIRTAILTGILVGISLWIKSIGFLFALVAVIEFLYIWYSQKKASPLGIALLLLITVAGYIGLPLFLRPEAVHIFERAPEYTYSIKELIAQNFGNVGGNVLHAFLDYVGYISPFVVLAFIFSLRSFASEKKRILAIAWILVFCVVIIFGRSVHARYVLFTAVPVIVLSSLALATHKILLGFTVTVMTLLSAMLIINPPAFFHLFPTAQLQSESFGYIDGWPSGYGVKEALTVITADSRGEPAIVAVRWDSGNPEDAMFVYTEGNSELTTRYLDPRLPEGEREVLDASLHERVYFVTRQGQYNGLERYLMPLARFPKPGGKEYVEVFRVKI